MSVAALIRSMADAGAPPEAIALAVEAIEAAQEKQDATRLAARDRKRRERERSRQSRDSHATVTPLSEDIPPSKEKSPTPPKETQPSAQQASRPEKTGATSRMKSRFCPPSYSPGPRVLDSDAAQGFTAGEIERELAKFKDHQFRDAHSDWDAAFRNWLRKAQPSRVVDLDAKRSLPPASPRNDRLERMLRGAVASLDR